MKPVKLVLNGKEYTKERPTINDWYNHLDALPKLTDKNLLLNKDAAEVALDYVAKYVGCTVEDILKYGDMQEVISMYNRAQKSILNVFETAQGEWGNAEKPE